MPISFDHIRTTLIAALLCVAGMVRPMHAVVWARAVRCVITLALLAASFLLSGCGFAQYSKVRVQVVDQETRAGIYKAQLRTFYTRPMLDMPISEGTTQIPTGVASRL